MDFLTKIFMRLLTDNKRCKRWRVLTTALVGIVVFSTSYMLILPAITMNAAVAEETPGVYLADDIPGDESADDGAWYDELTEDGLIDDNFEDEAGFADETADDWTDEETADAYVDDTGNENVEDIVSDVVDVDGDEGSDAGVVDGGDEGSNEDGVTSISDEQIFGNGNESGTAAYTITELSASITDDQDPTQDVDVRLAFDASAGIPDGTELHAEEIKKNSAGAQTYDGYAGAADEALRLEDDAWALRDARFFSLRLENSASGLLVEPAASVTVELTFAEPICADQLRLVHFNDYEEAALPVFIWDFHTDANADGGVYRVSFATERFSVIGVVMGAAAEAAAGGDAAESVAEAAADSAPSTDQQDATENTTGENNSEPFYPEQKFFESTPNVRVQVYAEEGAFPEGTMMTVDTVDDEDTMSSITDAAEEESEAKVRRIHAVDISFWYNNEKIEPRRPIRVEMTADEIGENEKALVVHVDDGGNAETLSDVETVLQEEAAIAAETEDENHAAVASEEPQAADTVVFEAEKFSVYAIVYTVDFSYTVNGQTFDYSLQGGEAIRLSELAEILGMIQESGFENVHEFLQEIDSVVFSDTDLVSVTEDNGDWLLQSLKPFYTEEALSITLMDGREIIIHVTDAQYPVAGSGSGSIAVSKVLEYASGTNKLNGPRIYFTLVKDGEYVRDSNGNIYYKEMFMQGDTLNPSTVTFDGLEDGEYEVWEMHGDPNNGSLNRSYDGMLLSNDTVEIDQIRVIANSNGLVNASGLYNNNVSIKNGSSESMTFRNTYKPASDKTSFEANKVWMDRKENVIQAPEDATIVFTLYKKVGGVITSTGKTIVLNGIADNDGEANPWQAVFSDLPKTENGQMIQYMVRETTGWPDYYVCKNKGKNLMKVDEYLETNGGTIYNRHLLATIQIQKHFDIQPNKYSAEDWAEMLAKKQLSLELTNETTHETWYFTLDESFSQSGQLFYYNVENMQAGHYVLKEYRYKGLITDRKWDRGITIYERDINPGDNMDNPLFEMQVQNWYVAGQDEPEGTYIKALKVWDDLDDFDHLRPASITVRLQAAVNGAAYILPAAVTNPVTLSEANGWSTQDSWYNLPILDEHNDKIEYSIEEVNVPDGYESKITSDTNGTDISYTITNTHRPVGAGSLKLKKIVNAPANAPVPSTYYFTVKDAEGRYYTGHSVSGPDGYYTAIPIQAGIGEDEIMLPAGTYTVSEIRDGIEVSGYTLTVTGEGDYTVEAGKTTSVTITNTYEGLPENAIRVQKKWQDENGNAVSGDGRSATVQLRRYHYVSDGGESASPNKMVSITLSFPGASWNPPSEKTATAQISGNSASVTISDTGGIGYYYDSALTNPFNNGSTIDFSATSNVTLYANQTWASASHIREINITSGGSDNTPTYSLEQDTSFASGDTILAASSWSHTWTIGGTESNHSGYDYPAADDNGNNYLYYVVEMDEIGSVVGENGTVSDDITLKSINYRPSLTENAGITSGVVTVTNSIEDSEETGSIKITKNVLYNDEPDTDSTGKHFYIGVYKDEGGTQKVGEAHIIVGYHDGIADDEHKIDGTGTGWSVIENLEFGTYYIYEMDIDGTVKKNGDTGIMQDGNEYTINSPVGAVTVGKTQAEATVTNSRQESGSIEVEKIARTTKNGNSTIETTGTYYVGLFEVAADNSAEPAAETEVFAGYKIITAGQKVKFENLAPGKKYRVYELSEAITESNKSGAAGKIIEDGATYGEYTVSYTANEQEIGRGDLKDKTGTVITNEKFETDYIIQKRWMRMGGEWDIEYGSGTGDIQTVYFRLYRTVDGETYPVGWDGNRIDDSTDKSASVLELNYSDVFNALTGEAASDTNGKQTIAKGQELHWTKIFESLPGTYDQYHAVECSSDGTKNYGDPGTGAADTAYSFYTTCPELGPGEGENFVSTFAIKNDLVRATNTKEWINADDLKDNLWIRLQLMRNDENYLDAKVAGKDDNWSVVWDDLPKADPATGEIYAYTVEEVGVYASKVDAEEDQNNLMDKFTVTYADTAFAGDLFTTPIENEPTNSEFEFTKIWKDISDQDTSWQGNINITLYSLVGSVSSEVAKFELSETGGESGDYKWAGTKSHDNKWTTFKITGLPALDKNGNWIAYYVTEDQVSGYKEPGYYFLNTSHKDGEEDNVTPALKSTDRAVNGDVIINRPDNSVELPSTGGHGTMLIYLVGSILIAIAGVWLMIRKARAINLS